MQDEKLTSLTVRHGVAISLSCSVKTSSSGHHQLSDSLSPSMFEAQLVRVGLPVVTHCTSHLQTSAEVNGCQVRRRVERRHRITQRELYRRSIRVQ